MTVKVFKEKSSAVRYGFHVIFHPFDGFYDLKNEKKGNTVSATWILALALLSWLITRQYTSYFFSGYDPRNYNVLVEISGFLLPVLLWIVANWSLTTLMDGKGSMKDIYIATCYALLPLILILPVLTLISNALGYEEYAYYSFFYIIAFIWTGLLILLGTMVTHQYMLFKTVITCLLTIVAMVLIIFVAFLFYSVIQKVIFFIINSVNELRFRFY